MAVLSACETALIDGRVPDELVGLPSALVRLGVSGVVATQWAVSAGPATALLAARFYQLWLHDGLAPAQALAAAQRWTRDTTNAEKQQRFPSLLAPGPEIPEEDLDVWGSHRAHVSASQWAAFVLVGV
jgi:CHAT domain-containing protein